MDRSGGATRMKGIGMVTAHWNAPSSPPAVAAAKHDPSAAPSSRARGAGSAPAERAAEPPLDSERQLEAWFRAHYSNLQRLLARLGVPRRIIDDVAQDAFVTASRRQADVRAGREWAFLVGVAVRRSLNYRLRASARREVAHAEGIDQEASPLPDAEQLLLEKRTRQELEQALATLSDAHRAVFVLYELEGFSAPEIAALLDVPLGTVASRLGRARAKFSEAAARLQRAHRARREDR
jgi:RNA polymerase sigma-70 factor, ECF subfamily